MKTDHEPLQSVFQKPVLSAPCRLQRTLHILQGFNLNITYKHGPRKYMTVCLEPIWPTQENTMKNFQTFPWKQTPSVSLSKVFNVSSELDTVTKGNRPGPPASWIKGRSRVARVEAHCFWPRMNSDQKQAITYCSVCAEFEARSPKKLLQTTKIAYRPWISMVVDLFTVQRKECTFLVDHCSDSH